MSSFAGISPKLPVHLGDAGGYDMNESYVSMVKQNFRNLVLTDPGERMMDIHFGVGLKHFLFEQESQSVHNDIAAKITEQVARYLPFLEITGIDFVFSEDAGVSANSNLLSVDITYLIVPLSVEDLVSVDVPRFPSAL
tara:strand:- start:259 stop:672 length:414 start_codon:yes stop_codon:yes gene_type:complete